MCQLSNILTLGHINDKELRSKIKNVSLQNKQEIHFTHCIMGFILGNARMVMPIQAGTKSSETIDTRTDVKLRYAVATLRRIAATAGTGTPFLSDKHNTYVVPNQYYGRQCQGRSN